MTLEQYTANHRYILDAVAKATGITDPVAFVPSQVSSSEGPNAAPPGPQGAIRLGECAHQSRTSCCCNP